MDQWVTDSYGLVHLSYDDFSSVISYLFGIVVTVYNKPDYARVTPYSKDQLVFGVLSVVPKNVKSNSLAGGQLHRVIFQYIWRKGLMCTT